MEGEPETFEPVETAEAPTTPEIPLDNGIGLTEDKEYPGYILQENTPGPPPEYRHKPGISRTAFMPAETGTPGPDDGSLPYLESEMILLPSPKDDDIASYIMSIGDEKNSVKFYTNSIDNEVSILAPGKEEKIYNRKIGDIVDYSIKLDSMGYSISNTFLSSLDDKLLKLYFAWELRTNVKERIPLGADFYIFGREPLGNLGRQRTGTVDTNGTAIEQLIRLNKSDDDFWRIGASRDHALLLKTGDGHSIFNISLSYPVFLLKAKDLSRPICRPLRVEPVPGTGHRERLASFLSTARDIISNSPGSREKIPGLKDTLTGFADWAPLENNDMIIIGSKVFKYIVPLVMESVLSDRVQKSILRKSRLSESVLR
jgi:hypothetical protein